MADTTSQKIDKKAPVKNKHELDFKNLTNEQKDVLSEYIKMKYQSQKYPINEQQSKLWTHKFWSTQPVNFEKSTVVTSKPIQEKLVAEQVVLPAGFDWEVCDLNNNQTLTDVATFLQKNYVEDITNQFRLHYSSEFIKWAIGDTGVLLCIRLKVNNMIVGTVSATIKNMQVNDAVAKMGEVNFLCVDTRLRNKSLVTKLISEIKNTLVQKGVTSGFFTTTRYIPTPFCKVKYFHRPVNYIKLYAANYVAKDATEDKKQYHMNVNKFSLMGKLPDTGSNRVEKLTLNNSEEAFKLYVDYSDRFNFHDVYTLDEFRYWFINNQVSSYVIFENNKIVDMFSYYKLNSHVLASSTDPQNIPEYVKGAYMFMYTSLINTPRKILDLATMSAHQENLDVLTITNIMENEEELLEPNGDYLPGSGELHYNFYNWTCQTMQPGQLCKVAL